MDLRAVMSLSRGMLLTWASLTALEGAEHDSWTVCVHVSEYPARPGMHPSSTPTHPMELKKDIIPDSLARSRLCS